MRDSQGYTLIELMVVLAVLGLLASLAMPMAELVVQRDKERELKRALWEIRDAIDAYRRAVETGQVIAPAGAPPYPATLEVLLEVPTNAASAGTAQRFLRRIPRDPFGDRSLPPEKTWALRSYESSPDRPHPGSNVYDVHSMSDRIGLNGVPLRKW